MQMRPNSNMVKDVLTVLGFFLLGIAGFLLFAGCACSPCRGDEARPSPQSPQKWAPVPARDFQTPPTDGPDPAVPPPPVVPQPTPTVPAVPPVAPAPAPAPSGTAEMTTSSKASGAINILGNTGTITLGNTGLTSPSSAPSASPQMAAFPLLPGPLPDATEVRIASRLGGSLYHLLMGKCPAKPAATPAAYLAVPQQSYAMVPVQAVPMQMQTVQVQAAPMPQQAPQIVYAAAPMASPQSPAAPKKCRLFGR